MDMNRDAADTAARRSSAGDRRQPPASSDPTDSGVAGGSSPSVDRPLLRRAVTALIVSLVVLGLVRVFVLEPFRIPTGSMRPTIVDGDVILVNKLPYNIRSLRYFPFTHASIPQIALPGIGTPERGDVAVFEIRSPLTGHSENYLKRIAAIAGDTVRLVGGRIRVNGRELPPVGVGADGADSGRRAPIRQDQADELFRYGGAIVVPYSGYRIDLDSVAAARWGTLMSDDGARVAFRNHIVFVNGIPATTYTFKHDYFLALGDNSADSYDSRYFGFISYDQLVGRAVAIYWSRDPHTGAIRWERIGRSIR